MKMIKCAALAAVASIAMAACATDISTPESVRQGSASSDRQSTRSKGTDFDTVKSKVEFVHDQHVGARSATAPQIRYLDPNRNRLSDGYNIYNIIGIDVGRSGPDVIDFSDVQIRIRQTTSGDWPAYNAAFSNGRQFSFTRIDTDVSCIGGISCTKKEVVGIDMTMGELRELAELPVFSAKITGKRNNMIVEIPQSYIRGFLAAIDEAEVRDAE